IDLEIRASVEGYIMNVLINEGQFVKAGQVLFEIDPRPFNENIKNASANLSVAESKRQQAQLEVDQLVPLVRDRVVSEIELKSAQIKLRTADKIVNQAQSFLDAAILDKSYTKIVAPVDGYVGRLLNKKGRFSNLNHPYTPTYSSIIKMMSEKNPQRNAKKNDTFQLPFIEDLSFLDNKEDVVIWLGHATFFIRINGISLITDPVFANVSVSERKSKLPFSPDLLRNLDYVLISHDHRDHLDKKSLRLIIENNPTAEILSGLRMDEWFNKMLVSPKTQLAGWYQQYHTDTTKVKIYFLPARHWSSINLTDANQHLWGSFIIQDNENTLF